jgi:hypothetical protein
VSEEEGRTVPRESEPGDREQGWPSGVKAVNTGRNGCERVSGDGQEPGAVVGRSATLR